MNDNDESKRGLFPPEQERKETEIKISFSRWWLAVIFIAVVFVTTLFFVKSANAEHKHEHDVLVIGEEVDGFTLACDTQEQLELILTIYAESGSDAGEKQYRVFSNQKNEIGESICTADTIITPVTILEKMAVFHDLEFGEEHIDVTIIKVKRSDDPKKFFITTTFPVVTKDELAVGQEI